MTDEEILEKAMQKAIISGWDGFDLNGIHVQSDLNDFASDRVSWPTIIYNHDFAKALWGEEYLDFPYDYFGDTRDNYKLGDILPEYSWQYHLQQMVIANDPLKYLGDNLI